ncbi:MAG: fibronectin type III domain-containing protein [Elusimicrobiota bacterium]|nr:fibronectin type III domain-containing protein [Elusimicrobiota bacterium]
MNDELGYNFMAGTSAPFEILAGTDTLGAGVNSWTETGLSYNTPYTRFVQAVDEGNVKNSTSTTRYTLPAVSAGVTIQDRTASSISIGWGDGSNPSYTRWQVWRSTDDFVTAMSTVTDYGSGHTDLSLDDSSLEYSTTYFYKVRPINEDGLYGTFTTSVSTLTLPPPPNAPSTFTATALSSTEVRFDWGDESGDELGFSLLNSTYGIVADLGVDTTYWIDNSLTPNTTSQVRYIRSYHADSASENIAISTNPFTFTNAAGNPQVSVTTTTVNLTWELNSNPSYTRWEILRSSTNFSSTDTLKNFSNNFTEVSLADSNLTPDTTYQYKIRSLNEDAVPSNYSSVLEGLTIGNPGKITGLSARQDSGSKEILISWTSPGDNWYLDSFDTGSLFKIQYSTDPAVSWSYNSAQAELDASGTAPGVTVSTSVTVGLESTYYIKVWAKDDMDNWSVASDSAAVYASRFIYQDVGLAHSSVKSVDLALSGGYPQVVYRDDSGYLKYGKWNTGSESFDLETVESEGVDKVSIDIDSSGNPHLSYYNTANKELRYAKWTGIEWATQTLRTVATGGGDSTVVVDSEGKVHIAFAGDGIISYHKWDGVQWSTAAAATYVGTGGGYDFCDLAVDARGYPHISFYTHQDSNHALKYTTWDGSSWQTATIDAVTNNIGTKGEYNSITLDKQGLPRITYWDYQSDKLKYAYKNPDNTWTDVNLDDSAVGGYSSIALDGSDNPALTYFNNGLRSLEYDGAVWAGGRIDGGEGDSEVKLDISGRVHAAYINNNTVRYAKSEAGNTAAAFERPALSAQTSISSITWSWSDLSSETGYKFYNSAGYPFNLLSNPAQNASSFEDTGLAPNTAYSRFLQAVYNGGVSNSTQAVRYTRSAPPVSLQFGEVSDVDASFSWGANSNPSYTSWKIMRSTDGFNTDSVTLKDAADSYTATEYTAQGLVPQTTYFFRVYAYNEEGYLSSGYMEISTATFVVAPSSPTGFSATAVSSSSVLFSWTDNASTETGYILSSSSGATNVNLEPDTTCYFETGLLPNTSSYIFALIASGLEVNSDSVTLSAPVYTKTNAPSDITVSTVSAYTVTINWQAAGNPSGTRWNIVRSSDAFASSSTVKTFSDNFTQTLYTDTGLEPYKSYWYRVHALNGNGLPSDYSADISTVTSDAFVGSILTNSGEYPSLAVDSSDNLHAVYYNGSDIVYSVNEGSGWAAETVESGTGRFSAIAADSAGSPHVVYNYGSTEIHYASRTASGWLKTVFTETSAIASGYEPSAPSVPAIDIKIDVSGAVHIAYFVEYDDGTTKLQYKKLDSGGWTSQTVSTVTNIGSGVDIAFDSLSNPYISFIDANDSSLRSARYAYNSGSGWVMPGGYGATNSMGWETEISLDSSDNIWILYNVGFNLALKYVKWDSGNPTEAGTIESAAGYDIGQYPDFLMDNSDALHMVYSDDKLDQLKYVRKDSGSTFTYEKVDDFNDTATSNISSLVLDSYGNPHVIYSTSCSANPDISGGIKYAHLASPDRVAQHPSGFRVSAVYMSSVTWAWNDVEGETSYRLMSAGSSLREMGAETDSVTEEGLSPNTLYTRYVSAVNAYNTADSDTASVYTLAAAPSAAGIVSVSTQAITLNWSAGSNPAGTIWGIERSTDASLYFEQLTAYSDAYTALTYSDTSVLAGVTYYYRIKAFNGSAVAGAYGSIISTMPVSGSGSEIDVIIVPGSFSGNVLSDTGIFWTWQDLSTGEDAYKVFSSTGGLLKDLPADATSWTETGLQPGFSYSRYVSVVYGGSSYSTGLSNAVTIPSAPSGVTVSAVSISEAEISWVSGSGLASCYSVQKSSAGSWYILSSGVVSVSLSDTDLGTADTSFYYRVAAVNSEGVFSSYSDPALFRHIYLLPPENLSFAARDNSVIQLSWEESLSENISHYLIYSATGTSLFNYSVPLATVTAGTAEYTTGSLVAGKVYYFVVRAVNMDGFIEQNESIVGVKALASTAGLVKTIIENPFNGKVISGNSVMLFAGIQFGSVADITSVHFEYKTADTTSWQSVAAADIQHPNPDTSEPYFVHWDVSSFEEKAYNVRAVAKNTDAQQDDSPGIITININHTDADVIQICSAGGEVSRKEKIDNRRNNFVKMGNAKKNTVFQLAIPSGALADEQVAVTVLDSPLSPPSVPAAMQSGSLDEFYSIELDNGQSHLSSGLSATLTVEYEDADLDAAALKETMLSIFHHNDATGEWEKLPTTVDTAANVLSAQTDSFSFFGIFASVSSGMGVVKVYPNPYKPGSTGAYGGNQITFAGLAPAVEIKIFNLAGRLVAEPGGTVNGSGELAWAGARNLASGVYMYIIRNAANSQDKAVGRFAIIK